jgi:hypothetical protein
MGDACLVIQTPDDPANLTPVLIHGLTGEALECYNGCVAVNINGPGAELARLRVLVATDPKLVKKEIDMQKANFKPLLALEAADAIFDVLARFQGSQMWEALYEDIWFIHQEALPSSSTFTVACAARVLRTQIQVEEGGTIVVHLIGCRYRHEGRINFKTLWSLLKKLFPQASGLHVHLIGAELVIADHSSRERPNDTAEGVAAHAKACAAMYKLLDNEVLQVTVHPRLYHDVEFDEPPSFACVLNGGIDNSFGHWQHTLCALIDSSTPTAFTGYQTEAHDDAIGCQRLLEWLGAKIVQDTIDNPFCWDSSNSAFIVGVHGRRIPGGEGRTVPVTVVCSCCGKSALGRESRRQAEVLAARMTIASLGGDSVQEQTEERGSGGGSSGGTSSSSTSSSASSSTSSTSSANAPPAPLMCCTRCKTARYCDRACQKSHWKSHKKDCRCPYPRTTAGGLYLVYCCRCPYPRTTAGGLYLV